MTFSRFRDIARAEGECNITETKRTRKILLILHETPCDKWFIARRENIQPDIRNGNSHLCQNWTSLFDAITNK